MNETVSQILRLQLCSPADVSMLSANSYPTTHISSNQTESGKIYESGPNLIPQTDLSHTERPDAAGGT